MQNRWGLFLLLMVLMWSGAAVGREKVRIVSLEWPPYAGERLDGQGSSIEIIRQVFEAAGLELEVTFEPWNRALFSFRSGEFDAIAPEYMSREREETCLFSKPFQVSPIGFIVTKPKTYSWTRLEELADVVIGTVNGYVNTQEFDDLVARQVLTVDGVNDDRTNILKVAWGRISLAVMDYNVFQYLMTHDENLKGRMHEVGFNPQLLGEQKLYICFQPTQRGARLKDLFDAQVIKLFK